jgi:hypothetical protein
MNLKVYILGGTEVGENHPSLALAFGELGVSDDGDQVDDFLLLDQNVLSVDLVACDGDDDIQETE